MEQVWKFILQPEVSVSMPKGAELLSVAAQGDDICLWAKVNPEADKVNRIFLGFGTGHDIPDNLKLQFVGTAHLSSGASVFHIFEKI